LLSVKEREEELTMAVTISHDARWNEYAAEEWSDALVAAMKLGGIDHLFFVSGSEIAFWQESVAKAQEKGWPAPKLITVNMCAAPRRR
jgi:acetolactate synthase I/II/III large subunit